MSWNIRDNTKPLSQVKIKIVPKTPKTSLEKLTLTVVEMQQMPDIEKINSNEKISRLKWTTYNGRREVCVHFQTDAYKLNIVVYSL